MNVESPARKSFKWLHSSNKAVKPNQRSTIASRIFSVCAPPPPSLVGAYYLHPPDARAIFLHSNVLCNGTCSVTGGRITYWGGGAQTEKIQEEYHSFVPAEHREKFEFSNENDFTQSYILLQRPHL